MVTLLCSRLRSADYSRSEKLRYLGEVRFPVGNIGVEVSKGNWIVRAVLVVPWS